MAASNAAVRAAIYGAFKKSSNSLGACITSVSIIQKSIGGVNMSIPVPTVSVAYVDNALAGAIAGAVADGLSSFLP